MMKKESVAIGKRLREARTRLGLTQREVARFMGVSEATISYWESGQREIDLASVSRLCDMYGCRLSSILDESFEKQPTIAFALRAQELSDGDLEAIAQIKKIAMNLDELHELMGVK